MDNDTRSELIELVCDAAHQMYHVPGDDGYQTVNLISVDVEDFPNKPSQDVETLKREIEHVLDSLALADFPIKLLAEADRLSQKLLTMTDPYGDTHGNNIRIEVYSDRITAVTAKPPTAENVANIALPSLSLWFTLAAEDGSFLIDQEDHCVKKLAPKMLPKLYGFVKTLLKDFDDDQLGITPRSRRALLLSLEDRRKTWTGCLKEGGYKAPQWPTVEVEMPPNSKEFIEAIIRGVTKKKRAKGEDDEDEDEEIEDEDDEETKDKCEHPKKDTKRRK
eukprot:PhF_6_TR36157/c0_g1_i4/m.52591